MRTTVLAQLPLTARQDRLRRPRRAGRPARAGQRRRPRRAGRRIGAERLRAGPRSPGRRRRRLLRRARGRLPLLRRARHPAGGPVRRRCAGRMAHQDHRRAGAPRCGTDRHRGTHARRLGATRHHGRPACARHPLRGRQPRRPGRPRRRRPPAAGPGGVQLRPFPALGRRWRPHADATRTVRVGPAARPLHPVGRRGRAAARRLHPHHHPVRARARRRHRVGRPVAAVVPRVARVDHGRRPRRSPACRCSTASSDGRPSGSPSPYWPWRQWRASPRSAFAPDPPSATPLWSWPSSSSSVGRERAATTTRQRRPRLGPGRAPDRRLLRPAATRGHRPGRTSCSCSGVPHVRVPTWLARPPGCSPAPASSSTSPTGRSTRRSRTPATSGSPSARRSTVGIAYGRLVRPLHRLSDAPCWRAR